LNPDEESKAECCKKNRKKIIIIFSLAIIIAISGVAGYFIIGKSEVVCEEDMVPVDGVC